MSSVGDIATIPGELFAKFLTSFYADPIDAVCKALGVALFEKDSEERLFNPLEPKAFEEIIKRKF